MGRPEGRQRKRNYKNSPGQGIEKEEKRRGPSDGSLPRCSRQRALVVVGGQRRGVGQRRWGTAEGEAAEGEADFSAVLLYLTHGRL